MDRLRDSKTSTKRRVNYNGAGGDRREAAGWGEAAAQGAAGVYEHGEDEGGRTTGRHRTKGWVVRREEGRGERGGRGGIMGVTGTRTPTRSMAKGWVVPKTLGEIRAEEQARQRRVARNHAYRIEQQAYADIEAEEEAWR